MVAHWVPRPLGVGNQEPWAPRLAYWVPRPLHALSPPPPRGYSINQPLSKGECLPGPRPARYPCIKYPCSSPKFILT